MDLKVRLQELGTYLKGKLLSGDYEFVKCSEFTATIKIDNDYLFDVWIANDPKFSFNFYDSDFLFKHNKDTRENFEFTSQKDRLTAYKKMKPFIEEHKKKVLKREKQKEFNRLKKELESLG